MIRTFFSHLFESIKSLKRNGWMTVASASAVTITLVLVGIFMGVIFNATKLADDVEKRDSVCFVDIGTKQNEMKTLEKQLKGLDNVEDISYSNKDQQLKKSKNKWGCGIFSKAIVTHYTMCIMSVRKHQKTRKILRNKRLNSQVF